MRPDRVWHVVFNGNRVRILRRLPGLHEAAETEITMQGPQHRLRDHLSDRPTRSYASVGGRRSGVEPGSDPVAEDARLFVRDMVAFLEDQRSAGAFDGLVVVGSPDAIGLWRTEAGPELLAQVRLETVRNLVRLPARDLAIALRRLEDIG
ncbi:host attachment protein [Rhodobacterales bacterium HKCCE3408]|nr:host attachment protein [Rhodobacterales bacterium HKCCE3408]